MQPCKHFGFFPLSAWTWMHSAICAKADPQSSNPWSMQSRTSSQKLPALPNKTAPRDVSIVSSPRLSGESFSSWIIRGMSSWLISRLMHLNALTFCLHAFTRGHSTQANIKVLTMPRFKNSVLLEMTTIWRGLQESAAKRVMVPLSHVLSTTCSFWTRENINCALAA